MSIGEVGICYLRYPDEFLEIWRKCMRKLVSLKLTIEEWEKLVDEYKEFLMVHKIPVSRHRWMKMKILGMSVFDTETS
jgi:hypothetical protein